MDKKELKDALVELTKELEGKTKVEVKAAIEALETKYKEVLEAKYSKAEDLEVMKKELETEMAKAIKVVQDHADKLDIKIQKKGVSTKEILVDPLKEMITKGFDKIKEVVEVGKVRLSIKAVGNMTLATNLTGDQPRTFSNTVAIIPNQIANFSDMIGVINIGNGTYTFPREGAGEGAAATQTEGSDKAQIDTDITMVDVNTDFIAGYQVYSRKMANNLPFLESFLPGQLRRKYFDAENTVFNTALAAAATASSQIITGKNKIEMLMNERATLLGINFPTSVFVVSPADWNTILQTEKSTGAGYGLPGAVTLDNGILRLLGVQVVQVNWLATSKYYVGDFNTLSKVVTEGLSIQFSTEDEDNFRKNNITARVEAQVGLAIHRTDAIIYGDFTST